jgi:hydrogenase maturation factor HypF (carbamoyltransferase family)
MRARFAGRGWNFGVAATASPLSKRRHVRALQNNDALLAAAQAIREGKIVAVKGLGGFHLMADARNDKAGSTLARTQASRGKTVRAHVSIAGKRKS